MSCWPLWRDSSGLIVRSDTQSLTPSIWNYVRAHGRTYHGYKAGGMCGAVWCMFWDNALISDTAYLFPNDAVY